MTIRRIEETFDGCLRPVSPASPLLTSSGTAWKGFLLERDVCQGGHAKTILYPHTSLILVTAGWVDVENHVCPLGKHGVNRVTVWPAGFEAHNATWTPRHAAGRPTEMVRVQIDSTVLNRLVPDDEGDGRQAIQPRFALDDPTLATLIGLIEAEIAAGCPSGPLYAESICLALLARVHSRCAAQPAPSNVPSGTLSRRQLERVNDFIEANLGSALGLPELAALVGLSPGHFLAVFKATAGMTPHRYVVDRRIAQAKSWLVDGRRSIADVSTELGFASQSHFTDMFRRAVGTTPSRFRRAQDDLPMLTWESTDQAIGTI
jgi:AraC family transcriptional regulator